MGSLLIDYLPREGGSLFECCWFSFDSLARENDCQKFHIFNVLLISHSMYSIEFEISHSLFRSICF